ncbi:MAG: bifunctional oligoribonuclease/PAP phosphatase NrnA [Rhodothermia bacterium]|nr:MAG: bifunctional oligoribonuclease/PAP phosphatase NrnA [Rhodothermia bacterium]
MLNQILASLKDASSVVITTHTRPDGDGIGSQLALGLFLEKQGKTITLINHDRPPYTLDWLPEIDRLEVFDGSLEQRERIKNADVLVIADTNSEKRLGEVGSSFRDASGTKILIDHHTDSEDWFDLEYSRETASSTGELVYELMDLWDLDSIDTAIASSLYVAIMTDTGSFRFSNVTADVHRLIGDLIQRGNLDSAQIHANIFDRRSPEGIRLLSQVLATLEIHHDGSVGSMVISRRSLHETGASIEEAEGFVNHILSIEGVRVGLLFTETERGTKVSFRSKADDHVHKWAQALGGGGHRNAAGAFVRKSLEKTIQNVVDKAPKFIHIGNTEESSDGELPAEDAEYLSSLLNVERKGSVE